MCVNGVDGWDRFCILLWDVGIFFLLGEGLRTIFFTIYCSLFVEHRLKVLDVDALVSEAVQAHENGETMTVQV